MWSAKPWGRSFDAPAPTSRPRPVAFARAGGAADHADRRCDGVRHRRQHRPGGRRSRGRRPVLLQRRGDHRSDSPDGPAPGGDAAVRRAVRPRGAGAGGRRRVGAVATAPASALPPRFRPPPARRGGHRTRRHAGCHRPDFPPSRTPCRHAPRHRHRRRAGSVGRRRRSEGRPRSRRSSLADGPATRRRRTVRAARSCVGADRGTRCCCCRRAWWISIRSPEKLSPSACCNGCCRAATGACPIRRSCSACCMIAAVERPPSTAPAARHCAPPSASPRLR